MDSIKQSVLGLFHNKAHDKVDPEKPQPNWTLTTNIDGCKSFFVFRDHVRKPDVNIFVHSLLFCIFRYVKYLFAMTHHHCNIV